MALLRYPESNPLVIGEPNGAKPKLVRATASRWFMRAGDQAYVTGDGVNDAIADGFLAKTSKGTEVASVVDPGSDPVLVDETPADDLPAPEVDAQYDETTVATDDDEGEVIPDDLLPYFDDDGVLIESLSGTAKDTIAEIGDDKLKARAVRLAGDDRKTVTRHVAKVLEPPEGD